MNLDKIGLKQVVYFSTTELVELLLYALEHLLLGKMLDSRLTNGAEIDLGSLEQLVKKQTEIKANSKEHEYWMAIFSLMSEFGEQSEIGFYLEDKFNKGKDHIDSLKDLETFKQENNQCDVIIKNKRKVYEFQLKRYRDEWSEKALSDFIKKKILQYSDPTNYLITIQSNIVGPISLDLLENLSSNLGKLTIKKDLGIICFTFNANNEHTITVRIYPDYRVTKQPFVSGSDQVKKLYNK